MLAGDGIELCSLYADAPHLISGRCWPPLVDHHVADEDHLLLPHSLRAQTADARFLGDEEQVVDGVGELAVDLLGHRHVERPEARFHVRHLHPHLLRGERAGDRGVHIPHDDDPFGPIHLKYLLEGHHDLRRLLRVASRAHLQVLVGFRDRKFPEENLRHVLVVMLHGVDDRNPQIDAGCQGRILSGIRARTIGSIFMKLGRAPATMVMEKGCIISTAGWRLSSRPSKRSPRAAGRSAPGRGPASSGFSPGRRGPPRTPSCAQGFGPRRDTPSPDLRSGTAGPGCSPTSGCGLSWHRLPGVSTKRTHLHQRKDQGPQRIGSEFTGPARRTSGWLPLSGVGSVMGFFRSVRRGPTEGSAPFVHPFTYPCRPRLPPIRLEIAGRTESWENSKANQTSTRRNRHGHNRPARPPLPWGEFSYFRSIFFSGRRAPGRPWRRARRRWGSEWWSPWRRRPSGRPLFRSLPTS